MHPRPDYSCSQQSSACLLRARPLAEKLTIDASRNVPSLSADCRSIPRTAQQNDRLPEQADHFTFNLKPGRHYDVTLNRIGGSIVRLIDLSWYNAEPPAPNAGCAGRRRSHSRSTQIVTDIKQFTNHNQMVIALIGDGDRAIALMDLRRDSAFPQPPRAARSFGESKSGTSKTRPAAGPRCSRSDRLIDRQRFASADEFEKVYASETWAPMAKGLAIDHGHDSAVTVELAATTRPAR